jgi:hypothetical protein
MAFAIKHLLSKISAATAFYSGTSPSLIHKMGLIISSLALSIV